MRYCFLSFIVMIMISCGNKKNLVSNDQVSPTSIHSDTLHQTNNSGELYSIDYNNRNQVPSYGSILGKPMDTIIGADTVWFYYNNKLIFTEIAENSYAFYKNIKHWPKLVALADGSYIYLLEYMLGEPEGSEIVGFIFKNEKLIKKIAMRDYSWWDIDMSKDYSVKELIDIISTRQL